MSVKKLFLILGILLLSASRSFAAGGLCPGDVQVRNTTTGVLQALSTIGVTSCYFISAAGSDSAAGTSEGASWAHAPGMPNCTSTCATVAGGSLAGLGFIFKGGDTWHFGNSGATPYTGGVWAITKGGSSATVQTFYGASPSWGTGGRPIMTADNAPNASTTLTSCGFFIGGNVNNNNFTSIGGSVYTFIRGFEWSGMCQGDVAGAFGPSGACASPAAGTNNHVFTYGSDFTAEDNYFHGFSHIKFGSPTQPENCIVGTVVFNSHIFRNGAGENILYNVMDNSDSDPLAQGWGFYSGYNVAWNYIGTEAFANEMSFSGMCTFHDNTVDTMNDQGHSDWFQVLSEACNPATTYNNVFRHNGPNKTQGGFWLFGGATNYFFGNVYYDVFSPGYQYVGIGGTPTFPGNAPYIGFNNTFQADDGTGTVIVQCANTLTVPGSVLSNNHYIYPSNGAAYSTVTNGHDIPCATLVSGGLLTLTNELTMNNATAKTSYSYGSLAYSAQTYPYSPTSATSPTVGGGINHSAYCATMAGNSNALTAAAGNACLSDTTFGVSYNSTTHTISGPGRTVNARPATGAWDQGAYQYQAGVSNPILSASPTSLAFGTLTTSGACPGVGCASLSTTVTNVGTANATSISASISPANADYTITVSPASSLTPNSNTTITVQCAPTISGAEAATNLVISSNAPSVTIPLTCSGTTAAAITPSPSTLAFGNQQTSTTSTTLTDTVTSNGGSNFVFNATPYTLGGTNPGDFSIISPTTPTWTLVQHAKQFLCTSAVGSPTTQTCTATQASNFGAGHLLVALSAVWQGVNSGTVTAPTHNAVTGDGDTWTHCPAGVGVRVTAATNYYGITDCYYVLSSTGGSKTVTDSWTTTGYTTGQIITDLEVVELSLSSGTAALDTATNGVTSTNCTTCTGPAITLTGANDYILQWVANPSNNISSIGGGAYTNPFDNDNAANGVTAAFAGALNQTSGAAQTWTMTSSSPAAMSALAFSATSSAGNACVGSLTVMPNGTCTIQATFTPTTTGSRSATLTLNGNASGSISLTGTGTSSVPVSTPTLSPVPATYTSTQTVTCTISSPASSTCIYTTDGTTPTDNGSCGATGTSTAISSGSTISVSSTLTLNVYGCHTSNTNSGLAGGLYTITTTPTLAAPSFSVPGGSALSFSPITINLPAGCTGCYTIDGTTPAASSPGICSNGTTYSTPITITQNTTLQAIATESAFNNSSVTNVVYDVIVATPTFTPTTSNQPNGVSVQINISNPVAAVACYTVDGSTPAGNGAGGCNHGQSIANGSSITITQPTVVQAIGTASGYLDSNASSQQIGTAVIISPPNAPAVILML